MKLSLSGKTALVTGSTAGIGLAAAVGLAREGAHVILNGRTEERVKRAREQVLESIPGAQVSGVAADFSSAKGAAAVTSAFPQVDVLVNNVGIFEPKPFEQIPDEDWLRFFETNVMSGVRLSRFYFPKMKAQGWGRIVFVSSESAVQIPSEMIHYGMTKTAQVAVARGLAELTTGTGVTVNTVLPGPTSSEGVEQFVAELGRTQGVDAKQAERDFFTHARPTSILKRFILPEEVANLIVYVCSPHASATNGASLRVDGGVVRAIL
ncbi:SDR family NAD(P)-dependent oxidoreductase [Stigmatella aurantiaca]|uniref:Short-chain dehydrogenase/reductase SDR n=1 Tax=Stigmatella aurantiaca (strain DW4/3-1) TaxID=378806 RepID=Q08ME2_STIAD|nr:SDR family NAD(P)-dependent oxidoreductase [Stigmatella aurantiaca]ADO71312.1 Short-chain dehydrogenase/reductase SDR [Stigmatella aurantiaca DW4/3-1]EAU61651.1 short-chain dehydrogenase/reductase SDR [Stigmatella aurantiaca DW4/3-1]